MTDSEFIAWLQNPNSVKVLLVEAYANVSGSEALFRLSNKAYTTQPTDTPANTVYIPCVIGGVDHSESLSLDGSASISYGGLEIDNRTGERDSWLDYVWANRSVQIYFGDSQWPRADFRLIFDGVISDLERGADTLSFVLLDKLAKLNNPLSEVQLGGTTDNAEQLIPLLFGECHNIAPLLTNPALLEYQVHNGPVEEIAEVRNNGIPVGFTPELATGKFTLTVNPAGGTITASVRGSNSGGYANDIATLIAKIVTGYGPANSRLTTSDIDTSNFAAFAAAHPQPVGLYCADRTNVLEACQALASSVGAQVVFSSTGKLRLVKLAVATSGDLVTATDMLEGSLNVEERIPVKASCRLGYCRNWTVQESLAAGVPPQNAAMFSTEFLFTKVSDAAVATTYRLGIQPTDELTLLLVSSDAEAEAARRLNLWKIPRAVYSAQFFEKLMLTELGDGITIQHPRYRLSAGKTGTVIRINRNWISGEINIGILA